MYQNAGEADMRLRGCVVLYDNIPVCIERCAKADNGKIQLTAFEVGNLGNYLRFNLDDPKLNYRNIKLGFMLSNLTGRAYYVVRMPIRRYKQGLSKENTRFKLVHTLGQNKPDRGYTLSSAIKDKGFASLLRGEKQDIQEILEAMRDQCGVRIVNRFFMFEKDELGLIHLYYKGVRVGYSNGDQCFRSTPTRS